MARSALLKAMPSLAAIACNAGTMSWPPQPQHIEPSRAIEGREVVVTITGEHFHPKVIADFISNELEFDTDFEAFLGGTPLKNVVYVDSRTLTAVVPDTLPVGNHSLTIIDPRNQTGVLPDAFVVTRSCRSNEDCTDHNLCNGEETCVEEECTLGLPLDCGQSDACILRSCDPAVGCISEWAPQADRDNDGFFAIACGGNDCDDDPHACGAGCYPQNAAPDICDTYDQDCDGDLDEDPDLVWYEDRDGDGHGNPASLLTVCAPLAGFVMAGDDCNDVPGVGDSIHPQAAEIVADGVDQDCSGDEICYEDLDGDGYGTSTTIDDVDGDIDCTTGEHVASVAGDCDDTPGSGSVIHPGAFDMPVDGIDQDCNGQDLCYQDLDGDSHGSTVTTDDVDGNLDCTTGLGVSNVNDDCDDDMDSCGALCAPDLSESWAAGNCTDSHDNNCRDGTDLDDPACPNLPPLAVVEVAPHAGSTAMTFMAVASSSVDANTAVTELQFRWDCNSDGTWDTPFSNTMTYECSYSDGGLYVIAVEVQDNEGLSGFDTVPLGVIPVENHLVVNTAIDEEDLGATPESPGGTGFSLREAIEFSNTDPGNEHIYIESPAAILLNSPLPTVDNPDRTNIIGGSVATIDGVNLAPGESCLTVASAGTSTIAYVEIRGCPAAAVHLVASSNTVRNSFLHDNGVGVLVSVDTTGTAIGPDNEIADNVGEGVRLQGRGGVGLNAIHHNTGEGVFIDVATAWVGLNRMWSNGACGIRVSSIAEDVVVHDNTIDSNGDSGLCVESGAGGLDIQNNAFTGSTNFGIDADASEFVSLDHNAYFGNVSGMCNGCSIGPSSVTVEPGFLDAAAADYRLMPDSQLIDQGAYFSVNVNGAGPGDYTGAAPDIGAWEAPY